MKKPTLTFIAILLIMAGAALLWTEFGAGTPELPGPAQPALPATGVIPEPAAASAGADDAAARQRTAVDGTKAANDGDADSSRTGELLVTVVWADGAAAADVQVDVAARHGGARALATLHTDAAGTARTALPAGAISVSCDRAKKDKEAVVVAGATCEVRLELPAGVDVAGTVRDAGGAPVAGARIWLTSFRAAWRAMAAVAVSDAQGGFAVRAAPKDQSFGATADGRRSALVDLETLDLGKQPVRVDLVLGVPGGALAGRVVDEGGKGIAGARVAVGRCDPLFDHGVDGRMRELWAPMQATTDAAGDYRVDCLEVGDQRVEVWAAAFPSWHGQATITAASTTQLDVTLPRGVTVHGTVSKEDGTALAGAIVRAFPVPIDEQFLMTGQYDYDSTFGYPSTVADAAGRYRLLAVAPGETQLYAGPGRDGGFGAVVPWAHEIVKTTSGAVIEWNPKVEPGPSIHGVVRYRDGAPMPHSFVSILVPGDRRGQSVTTDKEGRFRFIRLQHRAHDVSVQVWDPPKGEPPVEARDVWPDRGELVLTATYDAPKKLAKGSVRGSVVDSGGRAPNAAAIRVLLCNDERSWRTHDKLDGGRFRFADVEPGQKRLIVMYEDAPIHVGEAFELQPAEDKDFGVITTLPGGKLTLLVERDPGTETVEPTVYLRPAGSMHARKVTVGKDERVVVDNLCLGEHVVSSWTQGLATIETTCRVVAGDAGEPLRLRLRPATLREFVVEYGADQRVTDIRVTDEKGAEVWSHAADRLVDRPFRIKLLLPIGRFTCRVASTGGVATAECAVTSLAGDQPPVVVRAK